MPHDTKWCWHAHGCKVHHVALVLLDSTDAFDTVDNTVLLSLLKHYVGTFGSALKWFTSYLTNRTFSYMMGLHLQSTVSLSFGVLQGSILGPLLFTFYMLSLGSFIATHHFSLLCR